MFYKDDKFKWRSKDKRTAKLSHRYSYCYFTLLILLHLTLRIQFVISYMLHFNTLIVCRHFIHSRSIIIQYLEKKDCIMDYITYNQLMIHCFFTFVPRKKHLISFKNSAKQEFQAQPLVFSILKTSCLLFSFFKFLIDEIFTPHFWSRYFTL